MIKRIEGNLQGIRFRGAPAGIAPKQGQKIGERVMGRRLRQDCHAPDEYIGTLFGYRGKPDTVKKRIRRTIQLPPIGSRWRNRRASQARARRRLDKACTRHEREQTVRTECDYLKRLIEFKAADDASDVHYLPPSFDISGAQARLDELGLREQITPYLFRFIGELREAAFDFTMDVPTPPALPENATVRQQEDYLARLSDPWRGKAEYLRKWLEQADPEARNAVCATHNDPTLGFEPGRNGIPDDVSWQENHTERVMRQPELAPSNGGPVASLGYAHHLSRYLFDLKGAKGAAHIAERAEANGPSVEEHWKSATGKLIARRHAYKDAHPLDRKYRPGDELPVYISAVM